MENSEKNVLEETVQETVETSAPKEKTFTQDEVNRLIGREKENAALRAKREAEEQYQRELETLRQNQTAKNEAEGRQVDADTVYQQVQEKFNQEMERKRLEEEMSNVANSYLTKMAQGRERYEDFEDVTKQFDPQRFPQLVYLVAGLDNASDVVYELAKNPSKLVTINTLAKEDPKFAQHELVKLASSIQANQKAQADAEGQQANAPLDRLQPSRVSGSNGKMTISDLRNQPWLRG